MVIFPSDVKLPEGNNMSNSQVAVPTMVRSAVPCSMLAQMHTNANMGIISYKTATWVGISHEVFDQLSLAICWCNGLVILASKN